MFTSVVGVQLWNSLQKYFKACINVFQFKKMYKERIIRLYEVVGKCVSFVDELLGMAHGSSFLMFHFLKYSWLNN